MQKTTSSTITIDSILPLGVVTSYSGDVGLYVKFKGITTRYNATIVNSTVSTSGLLSVTGVPLTVDGRYSCRFVKESNATLETDGTELTVISKGSISKITSVSTLSF